MPDIHATFRLHDAIAAVAPITGVSIGRWDDRTTWRISFRDEATESQKQEALKVLAAYDPDGGGK